MLGALVGVAAALRPDIASLFGSSRPRSERHTVTEFVSSLDVRDVRFPTSHHLDGSDAMNPFPDYSAAYVELGTSTGRTGYGLAFTVGRGNDLQVAAIRAFAPLVVGRPVDEALADMAAFSRSMTGDSQLRWLGP